MVWVSPFTQFQAIALRLILFTACAVAHAAEGLPAEFIPSAQLRAAILNGQSERFPYPGAATDNAVVAGYDDVVVKLLMDTDRRKAEGPGALLTAIQTPDPHMVGLILALGVDPNEIDGGGPAALAYAVVATSPSSVSGGKVGMPDAGLHFQKWLTEVAQANGLGGSTCVVGDGPVELGIVGSLEDVLGHLPALTDLPQRTYVMSYPDCNWCACLSFEGCINFGYAVR